MLFLVRVTMGLVFGCGEEERLFCAGREGSTFTVGGSQGNVNCST